MESARKEQCLMQATTGFILLYMFLQDFVEHQFAAVFLLTTPIIGTFLLIVSQRSIETIPAELMFHYLTINKIIFL
jgi:hypothetical protein